jgi:hypothetical protein
MLSSEKVCVAGAVGGTADGHRIGLDQRGTTWPRISPPGFAAVWTLM